jgi:hypothetical protein
MRFSRLFALAVLSAMILFHSSLFAVQYVVTNTNDSGAGSLRDAINQANANPGQNEIVFNIPQAAPGFAENVWTIYPITALPAITSGSVKIDGSTQTTNQGDTNANGPEVVLSGLNIPDFQNGLTITSASNTVKGLVFRNFKRYGVLLSGTGATGNLIEGNYIGTDHTGTQYGSNGLAGITLDNGASGNTIGGDTGESRNLISANTGSGIYLNGSGVSNNTIKGNHIGTKSNATDALGNGQYGIYINGSANQNTVGPNNIIANNLQDGVYVTGAGSIRNKITQNSIYANGQSGIRIESGANNSIAGPAFYSKNENGITFSTTPNSTVEFFSDQENEGRYYEATVVSSAGGLATLKAYPQATNMTATVTDANGNTSPFSSPVRYAPFLVTNTKNSGEGSLAWAIEGANSNAGSDSIQFAIPKNDASFDGTVWEIKPTSPLPTLTDNQTIIDGSSQAKNVENTNPNGPEIYINGVNASGTTPGLILHSTKNTIQGLGIGNFSSDGILIENKEARINCIYGNYIGVSANGKDAMPNNDHGVHLKGGGGANVIGGTADGQGNILSGNKKSGVYIENTDSTVVQNNKIGCDFTGTAKLSNIAHGIAMVSSASYSTIGGAVGNVLSGNVEHGIWMNGDGVRNNTITNNVIGTDTSKTINLGNIKYGIYISNGPKNNQIGPNNCIKFNKRDGIGITGSSSYSNKITQNSITRNNLLGITLANGGNKGLPAPYHVAMQNGDIIGKASPYAKIEIFSDTAEEGEKYETTVTAGTDSIFRWAGTPKGPSITTTATDAEGNTSAFSLPFRIVPYLVTTTLDSVEGCLRYAIDGANLSPDPTKIEFNIPKDDANYDAGQGVWIIRPESLLPSIKGNDIEIDGTTQAKFIGEDTNPYGSEIFIDGSLVNPSQGKGFEIAAQNIWIHDIIIGNFSLNSILITGAETKHNKITGCYIGLAPNGLEAIANNGQNGISFLAGADSNQIGGTTAEERNIISGHLTNGISIFDGDNLGVGSTCKGNVIIGNYVGTDASGFKAVPNGSDGIRLRKNSTETRIGGATAEERNLISGNGRHGIRIQEQGADYNIVMGNWCGLTADGQDTLYNVEAGISLGTRVEHNIIGGESLSEANVLAGNHSSGIQLFDRSQFNVVKNNIVGLNPTMDRVFGNGHHGIFVNASSENVIGPGNIVCGNGWRGDTWYGIMINGELSEKNRVEGNYVGVLPDGTAFGNHNDGVSVQAGTINNIIGKGNVIAHNGGTGVLMTHAGTLGNIITQNSIYANDGAGIEKRLGAALGDQFAPPTVISAKRGVVKGESIPYAVIEVFMGPDDEGKTFVDSTISDATGSFILSADTPDSFVTATARDIHGNTTTFSAVILTAVNEQQESSIPQQFALHQNYPNPFNPSTSITFDLPRPEKVILDIFNINGQLIERLIDKKLEAGVHSIEWNTADPSHQALPSGTYFYRIQAGDFKAVKKLMLLK